MAESAPPRPPLQPGRPNALGRLLGIRIDQYGGGTCRAHLEAREEHTNPNGVMHGGTLFALADTAMGAALNSLLGPDEVCATIEIKMSFLKPVREGRLDCLGSVLRRGRTTGVLEARLENGGALVAVALGTFAIVPQAARAADAAAGQPTSRS